MPVEFKLPDVGEGVAEGELVSWFVEPGDPVSEDQPVAEVETDKALVEIPSPVNGTVRELRAEPGEMVPVGNVIIVFDVEGEEPDTAEIERVEAEGESPPPDTGESGEESAEASTAEAGEQQPEGRVFAPPHVRRLARELEVDLGTVDGSGPGGRITEGDVRTVAERGTPSQDPQSSPDEPGASREGEPAVASGRDRAGVGEGTADREKTLAVPATRRVARELDVDINEVPAVEERDGEAFVTEAAVREYAEAGPTPVEAAGAADSTRGEERVAYSGLRRTIGEQMERSKYTAPHVSHHDMADATALAEARAELKPRAEEHGISLTYLPFVMKAVVAALETFPRLNAELDEEHGEIIEKQYYNLGVAVATDAGLMVPVIDDVDQKGVFQIASEVNELAAKARDRSINREEMQGGTFTITNFGAIGGEYATPIINYPEVAILGLGAIEKRPVVVEDEVVPRLTLPISMSIDHRVVDGAEAARFTNRLIECLETPVLLLE